MAVTNANPPQAAASAKERHAGVVLPAVDALLRDRAIRQAWTALWSSRLVVFAAGLLAVITLGTGGGARLVVDPAGVSRSFGALGNVLAAPAVRWDAIWYLKIAHAGYTSAPATRFFPLYPILVRLGSMFVGSAAIAGVGISVASLFVGLVIIHRLTVLELGRRTADLTVQLIAFSPLALYFSAVYSEALFLMLSAGTLYCARRRRWALAGVLGGLGALTRVTGILLFVPVLLMYLYGAETNTMPMVHESRLRPRHRVNRSVLWLGLIPLGTGLYSAYLWIAGFGPLSFVRSQTHFLHHELMLPVLTVWHAAQSAWLQLRLGMTGNAGVIAPHAPTIVGYAQSVVGFLAVLIALVGLVVALRRLPFPYVAYVLVGLLVPLSTPTVGDPLKGFPRYALVLFPLYMVIAQWAIERGVRRQAIVACGALMVLFTVQFATWHVVGSQVI